MKALSKTFGFALAVTAVFAAFAAAATLALGSTSLSAGNAAVSSCGISSLTATRDVDNSGNVLQVNVSGVAASCTGETLSVTLKSSTGSSLGSASTTISGTTATVTGFGSVSATNVYGYAFAVEGA
ncbi:MAG: hypothetical protein ABUS54_07950 [Actinomycetota bacterium]